MTEKYLLNRLITLIRPEGMCNSEYVIQCAVRGIDVSLKNAPFVNWAFRAAFECFNDDICRKARKVLLRGLEEGMVLDFSKDEDCEYMLDVLKFAISAGATEDDVTRLFDVVLGKYRDTALGESAFRLNKAFGVTSKCYFDKIGGKRGLRKTT